MIKKLKPEEQLDYMLKFFVEKAPIVGFTALKVMWMMAEEKVLTDNRLISQILEKLKTDGFLISEYREGFAGDSIAESGDHYILTFDGELHHQQGGYEAKRLKKLKDDKWAEMEINRRHSIDNHLEKNTSRLNRLTLWLAIGTGALSVIELIKFIFLHQ